MNFEKEKDYYVSYCGSYCRTCEWFTGKIRRVFNSALDLFDQYRLEKFLSPQINAEDFRREMQALACSNICPGCKLGIEESGKTDRCAVRQCANARHFFNCSQCLDFPCPTLKEKPGVTKFGCLGNCQEIREKGVRAWIDGQWAKEK